MAKQSEQVDILLIAARAKSAGLTQEAISEAIGASQSQVSRILSGNSKRHSRLSKEICEYVNSYVKGVSPSLVKENEELIEALASVWNGTASQSQTLASIIRSLAPLCVSDSKSKASSRKDNQ